MLRIVSENRQLFRGPEYRKGWMEGLRRIAALTKGERSKEEWQALLTIFSLATKNLEAKVASFTKSKPCLYVVENLSDLNS